MGISSFLAYFSASSGRAEGPRDLDSQGASSRGEQADSNNNNNNNNNSNNSNSNSNNNNNNNNNINNNNKESRSVGTCAFLLHPLFSHLIVDTLFSE